MRRLLLPAAGAAAVTAGAVAAALLLADEGERGTRVVERPSQAERRGGTAGPAGPPPARDPFAFSPADADEFLQRGRDGLAHVLYEKSPGGVARSAERVERWSAEIEEAAAAEGVRAETLEAIVFLESAGRPAVIAGPDPRSAVGLGQIIPDTAVQLLGMSVDVERSIELTAGIARARERARVARRRSARRRADQRARRLLARRRQVDERFDPELALAGAARYLDLAEDHFGREDLAVASYHMGIGNLDGVIETYLAPEPLAGPVRDSVAAHGLSYVQLYFDSSPLLHPRTYRRLAGFGDDSRSYLFRVEAARQILRLHREDPARLRRLDRLHAHKANAEEVLRPPARNRPYHGGRELRKAYASGELVRLRRSDPAAGYRVARQMGELARELEEPRTLYRGLRPEALAGVTYLARQVSEIAGGGTLKLTSGVRDLRYQALLVGSNALATRGFSLHTTGFAFDVERPTRPGGPGKRPPSHPGRARRREEALVFALERLRALSVADWLFEPGAIHVTVGPDAERLPASPGAPSR